MSESTVLPDGGYLGFALRHQYPVVVRMDVSVFRERLKGTNAALGRVLSALGVTWNIRAFYRRGDNLENDYLHSRIFHFSSYCVIEDPDEEMGPEAKVVVKTYFNDGEDEEDEESDTDENEEDMGEDEDTGPRPLFGVTRMESMTYGNEPALLYLYAGVCVIVDLPEAKRRSVTKPSSAAEVNTDKEMHT
ncbi:hypothetical protein ID866_4950 [Astraeus odoratus]|nr:hypothetical protein ID866_4950 [Astraeus odoratus]